MFLHSSEINKKKKSGTIYDVTGFLLFLEIKTDCFPSIFLLLYNDYFLESFASAASAAGVSAAGVSV